MARHAFPALGFDPAPGEVAAIEAAAGGVAGAGRVFGEAASGVGRLNSSGWSGEAAEAFRGGLADLPRDLGVAAESYGSVARVLVEYGAGLRGRQRRAEELEVRAAELRRLEQVAVGEVNRIAGRRAPAGSAELAVLRSQYEVARSRAQGLGSQVEQVIAEARRLRGEHAAAAASAARVIRGAARAPYEQPGWLSRAWGSVKSWISDNAEGLARISTVLKGVSAVLGMLSLVPGLQFLAPFAVAAGAIALAIDVAVKLATGKGSWTSIGIDTALTVMPWARVGTLVRHVPGVSRGLDAAGDLVSRVRGGGGNLPPAPSTLSSRGNPVSGAGSTPVHAGNASNATVRRLFPELLDTNPLFRRTRVTAYHPHAGGPGFQNNCQSCVIAVDSQLAGFPASAIRRNLGAADDIMASPYWLQNLARAVGTPNRFQPVSGYDDIVQQLHNAGTGARGIVHGMRIGPGGVPLAGHVFNVVNRNGRVYFLDGQTGSLATLENYTGGLEFLRTG